MESGPFVDDVYLSIEWWFSIAVFNYQRVSCVEHWVSKPEIGPFQPTIMVVLGGSSHES